MTEDFSNIAQQPNGMQFLMKLLGNSQNSSSSTPPPDFTGANSNFSGGGNPTPPPNGGGPNNGGKTSSGAGGGWEENTNPTNAVAQPNSTEPETNATQKTSQNPMDDRLSVGLMMAGRALQGGNPMDILTGLMQSKLAQQKYMGQEPITKYEKASLAQNQVKIMRDAKKDELTNITDQMKQIEGKVGGIHKFFTGEPQGPAKAQWDSLYQQAEAKRQEIAGLDSRLTGESNQQTNYNLPFQVGQMYNGHKILKVEPVGGK
jgi:hypothetical protein